MAKRILLILLLVVVLAVLGAGGFFVARHFDLLPFLDHALTEEIPGSRPRRLDWREMEKYAGKPMSEIFALLPAPISEPQPASTESILLSSLPNAPLPYPEDAAPVNEAALRGLLTGLQSAGDQAPTEEEKRQFNLALAGLQVAPTEIPQALRIEVLPKFESDIFPFQLNLRPGDLEGAVATGNFDADPEFEIVAAGGSKLYQVSAAGELEVPREISVDVPGDEILAADYDSDGDPDLFLLRGDGLPNSLLRNEGDGSFTDVTSEAGLLTFSDTTCAAWLDYDGDGLLDLLSGSSDHPLELFRQTEGGLFQPIAWDVRLWVHKGVRTIEVGDFSGDGYADIYVGIDGQRDRLYRSEPGSTWDSWRFVDVVVEQSLPVAENSAGVARFLDFDNDGDQDLLLANSNLIARLFQNTGGGIMKDVTEEAGIPAVDGATAFGEIDIDSDGFQDLVIGTGPLSINRVLWNRGGTSFMEVSAVSRGAYLDSPVKFDTSDLDSNGRPDLLYETTGGNVRWLEPFGPTEKWLRVEVPQHLPGTKIVFLVRDEDWILHSFVRTLDMQPSLTVGLGAADLVERIDVFLPHEDSPAKTLEKIEPNQSVSISLPKRPGKGAVTPLQKSRSEPPTD